jgi:hypothetical protein
VEAVDYCSSTPCSGTYTCIRHKVRHWRENGSPLTIPKAFAMANVEGYTGRELEREVITEAKRTGTEIHRQNVRYF